MAINHLFIAALLLCSCPAQASLSASGGDSRQVMLEQKDIRAEMRRPMGKYSRFSEVAQKRIRAAQGVIFEIPAKNKSVDRLSADQQVALLNAVEVVKAIIADNQADMLQCWRERKTGTTLVVKRCETVAQRERLLQDSRAWKNESSACVTGPGMITCGGAD